MHHLDHPIRFIIPCEIIVPAEIGERQSHCHIEARYMMPPTDWQEQQISWLENHLSIRTCLEQRIAGVIDVVQIKRGIAMKVVVNQRLNVRARSAWTNFRPMT